MESSVNAYNYLKTRIPDFHPKIALVLGSGLNDFANQLDEAIVIPYGDIPGFQKCSVPGHKGALLFGMLNGVPVACMQGRAHYYEGYPHSAIFTPIRALKQLGVEHLILTNAAASLMPEVQPGRLVLINDHINFTGQNPLLGANDDAFGPRFPSMQRAYDPDLVELTLQAGLDLNIQLSTGVYLAVLGPSYETPAEIRAFKILGADLVGMSTVAEVIVARHCNMRVLAISTVTNMASGMSDEFLTHESVLQVGRMAADDLARLLKVVVKQIAAHHRETV